MTEAWAAALALGDDVFTERFGARVEPHWAVFPEVVAFLAEVGRGGAPSQWGLYLVFDDNDGALVGNAGWKGEPVHGAAELGYAVAPARRGRGIATANRTTASGKASPMSAVIRSRMSRIASAPRTSTSA